MVKARLVVRKCTPLIIGPGTPYQGLWVGDYSAHGAEVLLFLQRTPTMLEVIKVTGDPNVGCGEYSFIVPNLIEPSRVSNEEEFVGVRAVQGSGQIAGLFLSHPQWIDVEGI